MKRRTYLLDTLKDNEVTSTIVLKNENEWELDFKKKYNDIVDAFQKEEITNFEVINYRPFYKIMFRHWDRTIHRYIEWAYLYRFEENE